MIAVEVLLGQREGSLEHRDEALPQPSEVRQVVARLVDGDLVQIGTAPNRDGALMLARTVIAELESSTGDWPLVGDRLLRPDAIVSVDVMRSAFWPASRASGEVVVRPYQMREKPAHAQVATDVSADSTGS
jgi:hypothetical protein